MATRFSVNNPDQVVQFSVPEVGQIFRTSEDASDLMFRTAEGIKQFNPTSYLKEKYPQVWGATGLQGKKLQALGIPTDSKGLFDWVLKDIGLTPDQVKGVPIFNPADIAQAGLGQRKQLTLDQPLSIGEIQQGLKTIGQFAAPQAAQTTLTGKPSGLGAPTGVFSPPGAPTIGEAGVLAQQAAGTFQTSAPTGATFQTAGSMQGGQTGRLLGPTEFKNLSKEWTTAFNQAGIQDINVINKAIEQNFLSRDAQGNIFLKGGAPSIQTAIQSAQGTGMVSVAGSLPTETVSVDDKELSEVKSKLLESGATKSDIDTLIGERDKIRQDLIAQMTPTQKEIGLKEQLSTLRNQINQTLSSAEEGIIDIEGQPIPMKPLIGQASLLEKRANAKLSNLQRAEANLLTDLGLEQDLRNANIEILKTGAGFISEDIDLAFKVEDRINAQNDKLFDRALKLKQESRDSLATMLEMTKGLEFNDLSQDAQNQLAALAMQSGIPIDLLANSMTQVKQELLYNQFEKASKAAEVTYNKDLGGFVDKFGNVTQYNSDSGTVRINADGSATTGKVGTRSWRNNNPGNIKYGDYAAGQGAVGYEANPAEDGGNFAVFKTVEDGWNAMTNLLQGRNYRDLSVAEAMLRWSNSGYGGEVAIMAGISPNQQMSSLSHDQLQVLAQTMTRQEGGKEYFSAESTTLENKSFSSLTEDQRKRGDDLRKEYNANQYVKEYAIIKNNVNIINTAYNNAVLAGNQDSKNAQDTALITAYMKILDPNSVVRESEYDRIPEGISLYNRAIGWKERIAQGGAGITNEDRKAMLDMAKDIHNGVIDTNIKPLNDQFIELAESGGVPRRYVIRTDLLLNIQDQKITPETAINQFMSLVNDPTQLMSLNK